MFSSQLLNLSGAFFLFSSRLDANTATLRSSKLPSESRTHTHLPILENTYQVSAILFGQSGTLSVRFMLVLSTSSPVAMVPCKVAAENLSLYLSSSFFFCGSVFFLLFLFFLCCRDQRADQGLRNRHTSSRHTSPQLLLMQSMPSSSLFLLLL